MSPGGEKFAQLCCALASHILIKMPQCSSALEPPTLTSKTPQIAQYKLQMLKGSLLYEYENRVKLTTSMQEQYRHYKELSR